MPRQKTKSSRIVSVATVITTGSAVVTLPVADVYTFTLSMGTATGTSPTCDVSIQNTPDGGTTWVNTGYKFTQGTGTASAVQITVPQTRGMLAAGTVVAATGSLLTKDTVLSEKVRFLYTIGGTNPSYATITVDMFALTMAN